MNLDNMQRPGLVDRLPVRERRYTANRTTPFPKRNFGISFQYEKLVLRCLVCMFNERLTTSYGCVIIVFNVHYSLTYASCADQVIKNYKYTSSNSPFKTKGLVFQGKRLVFLRIYIHKHMED
jgi:hypothetical protein